MIPRLLLVAIILGSDRPSPPERQDIDASFFRLWVGPLALMVFTPVLSIVFWMACAQHSGSIVAMIEAGPSQWVSGFPMPSFRALGLVFAWTAFQLALLEWLPGKKLLGPPTPEGEQPEYRLNGIASWIVSHAAVVGAWALGWFKAADFYVL